MSEEAELRECNEAFESEEGDIEPYLEDGESSRELLERLRELENSHLEQLWRFAGFPRFLSDTQGGAAEE
ncbi:hypothetical protein JZ751_018032 [Albula glossodonta]|uniref:Uncharacterized protein n=1 Tax=Albula glossodonta TaxID=121402 RepID=A0A8T2PQ00_9TELE|nr:hypothetical protein JZ751_018032 [Albula glossodonta]